MAYHASITETFPAQGPVAEKVQVELMKLEDQRFEINEFINKVRSICESIGYEITMPCSYKIEGAKSYHVVTVVDLLTFHLK
jgi:hypothetical protein